MERILFYAKENKKYMYGAILLLVISTICGILPFYYLSRIIVSILEGTFVMESSIGLIVAIGGFLALKNIFFGAGLGLSHIGAFNTIHNMRNMFSESMARQPMGHIMTEGTGKYKKTFVEDIGTLETALAHMIPEGVPYICVTIFTIIAIFIADWRMGIAILIMLPISMMPMAYMMKVGLEKMPQYYESRDVVNHTLVEYISAMEVIKIFNKTSQSYNRLYDAVNTSMDFTLDWCKVTWKSMAVLYSMLPCTLLLPLPVGVFLFTRGDIELGTLTLVIMLALSLGDPLLKLVNFMPSIPMLSYNIQKIESVFLHEDVKNGQYNDMSGSYDIEFDDVTFAYLSDDSQTNGKESSKENNIEDKDVIKNVSIQIPQNSICAFVGPSGGGKSTLAKLLVHFWDVKSGSIKIGGRDIREFTFDNLMNHISYVSQENVLFDMTVYENIALAKDGVSKEEVIKVCKRANCHDFIAGLENGYDTKVGTLGGKLSGGEKQRISIARAILKDAPIVVLDEATAFADAENEFLIQEALSSLLIGKTVIIIAHKLHTISEASQIVVLDNGEIEHKGTHNELLKESELYKKLWEQNEKSLSWDLGGAKNA